MSPRRVRAATALAAAALLAAVLAAAAAGASDVKLAEAPVSNFPDMAFTLGLPSTQKLTPAQLKVTENRRPVQDVSVARPGAEEVGAVLLIDASKSMAGKPITEAMAAARAFAARRNPGQRLALVTFNDKVTVVLPLTSDAALIKSALAKTPTLETGTKIYDGIDQARKLLEDAGITGGSIVLLSDGKDVGSTIDQQTAIDGVNDAKARVFAVGLKLGPIRPGHAARDRRADLGQL